jgi:hypothetical protein
MTAHCCVKLGFTQGPVMEFAALGIPVTDPRGSGAGRVNSATNITSVLQNVLPPKPMIGNDTGRDSAEKPRGVGRCRLQPRTPPIQR